MTTVMTSKAQLIALCMLAALAGCASTQEPLPNDFEYGAQPDNVEDEIKSYFSVTLKDPDSAKYKFEEGLIKVACNPHIFRQYDETAWTPHWAKVVIVNAKNSYGGYAGGKRYAALFEGNSIIGIYDQSEFNMKLCQVIK